MENSSHRKLPSYRKSPLAKKSIYLLIMSNIYKWLTNIITKYFPQSCGWSYHPQKCSYGNLQRVSIIMNKIAISKFDQMPIGKKGGWKAD
jgi:hypothetical protein